MVRKMCSPDPMSDLQAYQSRMRHSPQFQRFNVEPLWTPGERDIEGFIHDEVVRQFHDPRVQDGKSRISWMLEAWYYARSYAHRPPTVYLTERLGALVEPWQNERGFRAEAVWIGNREAPKAYFIPQLLKALFALAPTIKPVQGITVNNERYTLGDFEEQVRDIKTADDFYLAYEWIHPFRDGNGRTGKILHNWLLGALDDPVLVHDYFGGWNP